MKNEVNDSGPGGIAIDTLLQTDSAWNGTTYQQWPAGPPEMTVLRISIPAGGVLRWHQHRMPTAAYVLSGEITVEEPGGKKKHYVAGQVIPEPVATTHRGTVGATPAVFIVFYAGVKGMPLSSHE